MVVQRHPSVSTKLCLKVCTRDWTRFTVNQRTHNSRPQGRCPANVGTFFQSVTSLPTEINWIKQLRARRESNDLHKVSREQPRLREGKWRVERIGELRAPTFCTNDRAEATSNFPRVFFAGIIITSSHHHIIIASSSSSSSSSP